MFLKNLFISLRPQQWIKNLFVFAALIFAQKFLDLTSIEKSLVAFAIFCLAASGIYLINDVLDYHQDREHPVKKKRPIAADLFSRYWATVIGVVLLALALAVGALMGWQMLSVAAAYIVLQVAYSFILKRLVIIDILCIAVGFVLRVIAGAVAIGVTFSAWLLLCTFFLTLFLAIGKRKNELIKIDGTVRRDVLENYSIGLLDQMNTVVLPSTLITYALYTFNSGHSPLLIGTIPVVLYGLFRYLWIFSRKQEDNDGPTSDLLLDRNLQVTVLIWVLMVVATLSWGSGL